MKRSGDVDSIEILAGPFNDVQNLDDRVGIHNASVDVPVQVRHC